MNSTSLCRKSIWYIGTPVFFLADAPARYNAWDEFVLYRFIAFAGNEFGTSLFFTLQFAAVTLCFV